VGKIEGYGKIPAGQTVNDPGRVDVPLHPEAIGVESPTELIRQSAIVIHPELTTDGTQLSKIQAGVGSPQRIEGPPDQGQLLLKGEVPLVQLEGQPDAPVPDGSEDSHDLAVQIDAERFIPPDPGN